MASKSRVSVDAVSFATEELDGNQGKNNAP